MLLCDGREITAAHLPLDKLQRLPSRRDAPAAPAGGVASPAGPAGEERDRILRVLQECGGNQTRAAELLAISRRTLSKRLDALGIPRPKKG